MWKLLTTLAVLGGTPADPGHVPTFLSSDLYFLEGHFPVHLQPDGNTLIWRSNEGLVVFDTGRHAEHTQAILDFAEAQKLPVVAIFNSHWHLDHVGGNGKLRAKFPKAPVYATDAMAHALTRFLAKYQASLKARVDRPDIEADEKAQARAELSLLQHPEALSPTRVVKKPEVSSFGGQKLQLGVEAHAVTSADLWVLDASRGVLATGDLVTLPVPFFDTACPGQWRAALARLAKLDFERLVPGHGAAMSKPKFSVYRHAFDSLLACTASRRATETCLDGWFGDTKGFVPATDTPQARELLTFYIEHHLKPENTGRYCNE
jgi:glyoxylase-like metal-dependent hydrolase (beta-lactamase superfamily II)